MSLTFTPPSSTKAKDTPVKNKEGITYRIETIFEKTIELDELSIEGTKSDNPRKEEDSQSLEYPLVKINNYIFNRNELRSVTIDCTEFLPKITVTIAMISQLFLAKEMPKDGDIISIAIRNQSDVLKIVRNDYVITGVYTAPNLTDTKSPVMMTFYGELFIPGLKSQVYDYSFEGTSYDALKDFAKKFGIGFASNEDNTDDKQIWLKANMNGDSFINMITERAWRDEQSFYNCWIDVYYNLNFININKQLISAENEPDVAALISNIDKNYTYGAETDESKTKATVKVFSNFKQFETTPFYIKTWRPLNKSSQITFQVGSKMVCELFEHNKFLFEDSSKQKYWTVPVEPSYDPNKTNKMILLRGRASYVEEKDEKGNNKNPELKRANYPYIDLYQKFPWLGVQYTISNPAAHNSQWDGNHHRNYQVAKVKNLINGKELEKLNLYIEVTGNNFNMIIGDKVPVALIRTDTTDNMKVDVNSNFRDSLDLFYSGWYIIKGFTLSWSGNNEGDIMSGFTHEFVLTRREWPTPVAVDPIPTTKNK